MALTETTKYKMCEGISGVWHYHLCLATSDSRYGLCGAQTMESWSPMSTWGLKPDHMPSSYCKRCEDLARKDEDQCN